MNKFHRYVKLKNMKLTIINQGINGEGVALNNGKIYFVPNAITGETVECEVVKDFGNFANTKLIQTITPSANRVKPVCPYYEKCGGCDLQHMNYDTQLEFKQNLVKSTLKKVGGIEVEVAPTIACNNQFNYRNKVSFSCSENTIGFKSKSSNNIVDVEFCPLADKSINQVYAAIRKYLSRNDIPALKNIVIRQLEGQALIAIVVSKKQNLQGLFDLLKQQIENFGLFMVINTRKDSVVLTNNIIHIGGLKNIHLLNDFDLTLTVDSFYQTNVDIQNKLYNHILSQIEAEDNVVNGYSGAGLLSAEIAKKAKHVYGIEINNSAHNDAENLKKCNKISNLTNICGDFFENFKNLANLSSKQNNQTINNKRKADSNKTLSNHTLTDNQVCNVLVLDPSKKGCGKNVMQAICGVEKIIYVSCNPIALAKDLREIKNDYEIANIQPFDMFPNTVSVETCATLTKKRI